MEIKIEEDFGNKVNEVIDFVIDREAHIPEFIEDATDKVIEFGEWCKKQGIQKAIDIVENVSKEIDLNVIGSFNVLLFKSKAIEKLNQEIKNGS